MDGARYTRIAAAGLLMVITAACNEAPAGAPSSTISIVTTTAAQSTPDSSTPSTTTTTEAPEGVGERIAISGDALPMFEPNNDQAVGLIAPQVAATSFDGTPVAISHTDDTYKMVVFLAHWCSHCQEEVPEVRDWLSEYDLGDKIEIISVSTGERPDRPNWPPEDWLAREQWPVPVIEDSLESDISMSYGLQAFPYWVFLGKDGAVLLRANGLSAEALSQIADEIKAFDASLESSQ